MKKTDIKELKNRALSGDLTALEKLRQLGVLSDNKTRYSMAPVSYAQRRLWFIDKMDHSPAYNLPAALMLEGKLNVKPLEKAFCEIISRHEILRTGFVESDGLPFQKIFNQISFTLPVTDLSNETGQQEKIREFLEEENRRCFNLSEAPLMSCRLLKLQEEKHLLLFNMHHIISDGWSIGILITELTQLYNEYSKGLPSPLPPLKFQYKNYVGQHEQQLKSEEAGRHKKFWMDKLASDTEVTELPADIRRPRSKTFSGRLHEVVIGEMLCRKITRLTGQANVSLFMFLISAVNILLGKYTGKRSITLGSPVSGRDLKDTEDQIGFYVNTLPLRNEMDDLMPFSSFLEQVKQNCIEAYEHQMYPFDLLVEDLNPDRDTSRNPLFEIMVSLQENEPDSFAFEGLTTSVIRPEITYSKMDLHFSFEKTGEGLKLDLIYNPDLYSSQRIERLGSHFLQLLQNITDKPGETIGRLEIILEKEKQQILNEFNNTRRDFPKEKTIAALFAEITQRYPDKDAVVYQGVPLSYSLLNKKANILAAWLQQRGLATEEPVAILMERSHELIIAILATLKAGGAYLPLDIKFPDERIQIILKDAGIRFLLTDGKRETMFTVSEGIQVGAELFEKVPQNSPVNTGKTSTGLAYILYTSGSTGKPKGSMIEEKSVIRLVKNTNFTDFTYADKIFSTSSVSFDATTMDIWGTLLNGGTLYLENTEDYLDPQKLKIYFSTYGINKILITTGLFHRLLEADQQQHLSLFEGIKEIFIGGDRISPQLTNLFILNYPGVTALNVYGPTENTCLTTSYRISYTEEDDIPIGKPIANTKVYILDKSGNLCPVGIAGELCTSGEGVSRGYLNRPDLDHKSFMANPFVPGEKLYRTGDIAQWDEDGNIRFIGRNDDQVKIRGFRIETGEIENTAVRCEGVSQAKIIVVQDNEQKQLVLYYTAESRESEAILKDFLRSSLPEYMIPDYLIWLKEFPLNQNGKIDIKGLPKPDHKQKYPVNTPDPSTPTEKTLVKIYKEILQTGPIPVNASFFSLGGHSLKAIRVISSIWKECSVKITLKEFFASPDIVTLSKVIQNKKKETFGNIPEVPEAEYYELSHAQKRLWVLDKIESNKSTYNIPLAIRIFDELLLNVLQSSFDNLIQRHEALRTVFIEIDGVPFQKVVDVQSIPIQLIDFSAQENPESAAFDFLLKEAHRPFVLSEFPLLRLAVIQIETGKYMLFLNIHHIVCDGWSVNLMIDDLFVTYSKLLKQEPVKTGRLAIQYKDYALWLNKRIGGIDRNEDRDYWIQKLGREITPLDLPTDFPRPPVKTYEGDSLWLTFPQELKKKLDTFCTEKRSSLFMALTAALKVLLYRYTAKEEIILGTPVAGRDHPDLEEQIGCFINTLVLHDRINPKKTFADILEEIKETAAEAFSHQMYPFDRLVQELNLPHDTSRSPLFDVMIVMQNTDQTFSHSPFRTEPVRIPMKISKFDLTFNFNDSGENLDLLIEYNTRLYLRKRIEQIATHLQILLQEVTANPAQSIYSINILSKDEKNDLLVNFNQTRALYPENKTITELFEETAKKFPANVAVVYQKRTLTYSALNGLSETIARNILREYPVTNGESVGVLISPSENMIALLIGILKAGGAYVPVDPEYPGERIKYILSESKMHLVITQAGDEKRLMAICNQDFPKCRVLTVEQLQQENSQIITPVHPGNDPDTTAYVIFTSGSTGKPKGCQVSHRNLVRLFINDRSPFNFGPSDVWIMAHSYCFDFSVWEMYGALLFGGKLIVPDRDQVRDIGEFYQLVREHRITVLNQTPGAFYKFADVALEFPEKPLSLRCVIFGGDKLNPSKLTGWIGAYPAEKVSLINMYGITETTIHVTYHRLTSGEIINNDGSSNIGVPLPETQVYILDEFLQLAPAGVYGEIFVSGTGLCKGYLNRPDLTNERFILQPNDKKSRMYKSGDMGRWLYDGTLEYLDRCDNQVQIRGYRVETAETEMQLRKHPAITDAVVIAVDKEGTKELAAYLVTNTPLNISEIKSFLYNLLPAYMIPSYFVQVGKIPLTPNGKLDKKALPPVVQNLATGAVFQTPETEIEAVLLKLWQEVLSVENISIYDNFFDLGGNSILLVKLYGKINEQYPGALEITDLFTKSKIAEQADAILQKNLPKTGPDQGISEPKTHPWHDMAIVGIASRIGSCETPEAFWQELCKGTDFIGPMPSKRIPDIQNLALFYNTAPDRLKFREYCYLPEVDRFDYGFFKLSPAEASFIDPGQRLFLETAYHAMEDAGYGGIKLWGSRTGVFIGASGNLDEYAKFVDASENPDPNLLFAAQTPSILASRLSYHFNLKGPALLVDTACSSSLVALHLACQSIRDGKIDAAIVGGTKLHLLPFDTGSRMEIDSSDARAHSFDDEASGTGGGEGVIAMMIKPLEKALNDRDNIYAVIKGSAINQDGNSNGITAPDADAQADVIDSAWQDAGIDPRTVSFIETHGTATKLGDPIEIDGITKAFKRYTSDKHICAIGAVKANTGHLDTVAGLAGVLKAVLCLKYKKLVPLVHFKAPNRNINFEESAAYINKELTPWKTSGIPLRCGVSSFGLSGTNCHVVLEEAPATEKHLSDIKQDHLLVLSSRDQEGLRKYLAEIQNFIRSAPGISPADLCYTMATGRGHYSCRLAVLFQKMEELSERLHSIMQYGFVNDPENHIFFQQRKMVSAIKKELQSGEITENEVRELSYQINEQVRQTAEGLAEKVAEAYVNGASVLWEEYFSPVTPYKVSLPCYPFERKRCWVQPKEKKPERDKVSGPYGKIYEHVFLNHCILDTPSLAVYSFKLNQKDWLLDEHKVMGHPTLPGVSYLQMAWEAAKNHFPGNTFTISDFYLVQPLTIDGDKEIEVLASVNKTEENRLDIRIHSRTEENHWMEYSGFKITEAKEILPDEPDIQTMLKQMSNFREVIQEDDFPAGEIVQVSKKWNCLRKIWWNETEQLAELAIPRGDESLARNFLIYPPLTDAALSFALDEPGFLPWSFGNVKLIRKPGNILFSYIKKQNSNPETRTYDVKFTDETGKVVVSFMGLTFKKTQQDRNFFHELVWKKWPLHKSLSQTTVQPHILYGQGCHAEQIREFSSLGIPILKIDGDNFKSLFQDGFPLKIIYLLPEFEDNNDPEKQLNESLYKVFDLARHLASALTSKMDLLFVGKNVQEVTGFEKKLNSLSNAIAGLGQVIAQENPGIRCRFLDMDEQTSVREILDESGEGFSESYYYRAIRNGERYIREIKPVSINNQKEIKPVEGVYVITGGTGGIGLELAGLLASRGKVKLALINRSEFPPREKWDQILQEDNRQKLCQKIKKIKAIEHRGSEVSIHSADVADFDTLKPVFESIKKQGKIQGVIHTAGIPGDGLIYKKDPAVFRKVISPKIHGTLNLSRLLQGENPGFVLYTSAITAIIPSSGQSDYTAANSFLDAFSHEMNNTGLNTININLTAWKETGMAYENGVTGDGVFKSISTQDAVYAIEKILCSGKKSVILGEKDLSRLDLSDGLPFYFNPAVHPTQEKIKPKSESAEKVILTGRENGNYTVFEKAVAEIWGSVLGYTEININDNYYDLGGDSILAIKISSLLEKKQFRVSIGDVFSYLTIEDMATFLESGTKKAHKPVSTSITPAEKSNWYPVSAAQRRLFILDQLNADKLSYHIPEIWNIQGNLRVDTLIQAFQQLTKRHEILRTSFRLQEDLPVQIVHEHIELNIPVLKMNLAEAEKHIRNYIQAFDLQEPPLFRVTIIELSTDHHLLLFDAHHIILDAFSMELLKKELFIFYEGKTPEPINIQYKDYAIWQNNTLTKEEIHHQKTWWTEQFRKEAPLINLPLDFPRSIGQSSEAGVVSFALDEKLTARIKKMSADEGVSTFMILYACLQIILHKYTHQEDIVIGVTTNGRNREELTSLPGMFVNNLPVRAFPEANKPINKFLNEVRDTLIQAFANQDYPFDELVENLNLKRDLSRSPLFDVVFSYLNFELSEILNKEFHISDYKAEKVLSSEYDLMFYGLESPDQIYITVKYKKALFKRESMERFANHFIRSAEIITGGHGTSLIGDLEFLSSSEIQLLESYNNHYKEVSKAIPIFDLINRSFAENHKKTAVLSGDRILTYKTLNDKSNQLANYLRKKFAVRFGDRIGIMLQRDESMIIAMLAVLKSGAAYVGIDPDYPAQRIEYILEDSSVKVLITLRSNLETVSKPGCCVLDIHYPELSEQSVRNPGEINTPGDPAYIIYTSGSTGQPKGVVITHMNLAVFLQWCHLEFQTAPFELVYATTSYCFDLSVFEIFYSLISGKTIRVLNSALEIPHWLGHDRQVLINTVPSLFAAINTGLNQDDFSHLSAINLAGEQIPQALIDGLDCDRVEVRNLYGPSEDTTYSTVYRFNNQNKKVLIGKPISNTQVYITDVNLKLVPPGHSGEICIAGDGLAKGYLFKDELTNERFVRNPFGCGRLYKTGDLGRWTETGDLEYLGRIDRQVKIRGFRIELGEIETHIRRYPGIENVVVVASVKNGTNDILAYLVTATDPGISGLKTYLGKILPAYMIPLYFVVIGKLPLTPNGKVDVKALPDPVETFSLSVPDECENEDDTEEKLASLWKQVLGINALNKHDSFFDLGGHSLKALRLLSQINREFKQQFVLPDVFEYPSVAGFAGFIKKMGENSAEKLTPLPKTGFYDVSHAQWRMWTYNRVEENSAVYNVPVVFMVKSDLNVVALEKSFCALIKKYELLRTCFVEKDGDPKQVIQDEVEFRIAMTETDGKDDFVKESSGLIQTCITTPFNLAKAPLIRVNLIKNHNRPEFLLVINIHHIVLDEWSIDILIKHLAMFYAHFSGTKKIEDNQLFAPSPVQYKEFASWQNRQIEQATIHRDYWLTLFKNPAPALDLPSDFPRPKIQTFEGKTETFLLSARLSDGIKKFSAANHATPFITILALFHVLFSKYSGQDDLVIGTPVSHRDHPDVQDQIGLFLNTLALRNQCNREESFKSFLNKVRKNTLTSFSHSIYPFDLLIEDLKLSRDRSRSPLFDVMLISQTPSEKAIQNGSGLLLKPVKFDYPLSKFDLSISYYPGEEGITCFFEYNTALFLPGRIRNMFSHFVSLTENVLADPDLPIKHLNIIPSDEKTLITQFSKGEEHAIAHQSVISMIEDQAVKHADQTAVIFKHKKLSYGQLNNKVNQLAHMLIANDISPGDFVGVMGNRSEWPVIAMLAIMKAGAVYVPVDAAYPENRIRFMLNDCRCKRVILTGIQKNTILPDSVGVIETDTLDKSLSSFSAENPGIKIDTETDSNAYVIYTSGTTGQPKGILCTHRCLLNLIEWQSTVIESHLKTLQFAPHNFDVSLQEILFALATGGILYLIDNEARYNMNFVSEMIRKDSVELLTMPFSTLNLFLDELADLECLKSLRHVITSGEQPYLNEQIKGLLKKYPYLKFHNQYGPSETHVVTSFTLSGKEDNLPVKIPAGRPLHNTFIALLNSEMQMVPVGIPGELYIGGYNVSNGYLNRPDLNASYFIDNPFGSGKLYKTGDLARWNYQGDLEFLGRNDGQIKLRGFRIELEEIGLCLQKHPDVKEVVVKLTGDDENKKIAAYYTSQGELDSSGLKRFLADQLPGYMVPSCFIRLDQFPRTASGKTDLLLLPRPDEPDLPRRLESVTPENAMEQAIAEVWTEILKQDKISMTDNFFDMGGNSIMAIRLMSKIQKRLGKKTYLNLIFEYSTIRQMAQIIGETDEKLKNLSADYILMNSGQDKILFFMPPGIGYSFAYVEYAKHLSHFSICALNFIESENPEKSMADILTKIQKDGAFYLFGHSAGGNMAFDVAVELQKRGRKTGGIVLLDCYRQMEVIGWSEEEYMNDAILYIEQNHAEFLEDEIKDAALQKIMAYRRYLNARMESGFVDCPVFQIEATDEIKNFGQKMNRDAWKELCPDYKSYKGYGNHMDMMKNPNLIKNAQLTNEIFTHLMKK